MGTCSCTQRVLWCSILLTRQLFNCIRMKGSSTWILGLCYHVFWIFLNKNKFSNSQHPHHTCLFVRNNNWTRLLPLLYSIFSSLRFSFSFFLMGTSSIFRMQVYFKLTCPNLTQRWLVTLDLRCHRLIILDEMVTLQKWSLSKKSHQSRELIYIKFAGNVHWSTLYPITSSATNAN